MGVQVPPVGRLLKAWRKSRRWSQMDLALEADVSTRHLSYVETGRSQASRAMLLRLAEALGLPLRERNRLLEAGGYVAAYDETPLDAPPLAEIRRTLQLLIDRMAPAPAFAVDRSWNLLLANRPTTLMFQALGVDPAAICPEGAPNALRLLFHPQGLRPHVTNLDDVARAMLGRARAEDPELLASLEREMADLGVPLPAPDRSRAPAILVPMQVRVGGQERAFFTTITTVGTPTDVTLQELRIESLLPADAETDAWLTALVAAAPEDGPG